MGCWNETCFLSNLAILPGDPVIGFILAAEKSEHFSDRIPHFLSPLIKGLYNDYGSIEKPSIPKWYEKLLNDTALRIPQCLQLSKARKSFPPQPSVVKDINYFLELASQKDMLVHAETEDVYLIMAHSELYGRAVELLKTKDPHYTEYQLKGTDLQVDIERRSSRHGQTLIYSNFITSNLSNHLKREELDRIANDLNECLLVYELSLDLRVRLEPNYSLRLQSNNVPYGVELFSSFADFCKRKVEERGSDVF